MYNSVEFLIFFTASFEDVATLQNLLGLNYNVYEAPLLLSILLFCCLILLTFYPTSRSFADKINNANVKCNSTRLIMRPLASLLAALRFNSAHLVVIRASHEMCKCP